IGFLIAIVDVSLSSMMTCHPVSEQKTESVEGQKQDQCTALRGPVLSSLEGLVFFLDEHGEAVTAAFTIMLAIFTGALCGSTDRLWEAGERQIEVARTAAEAAKVSAEFTEMSFRHTHKPSMSFRVTEVPNLKPGTLPTVAVELTNTGGPVYNGGFAL